MRHLHDTPLIFVGDMWAELVVWAQRWMLRPGLELLNPEDMAIPRCVKSAGEAIAILRIRRIEFLWALMACAGVVVRGTLKGILGAIVVSLVALNPEVLGMVQRSSLGETLGRERLFFNLQTAVERYRRQAAAPGGERASTDKQQRPTPRVGIWSVGPPEVPSLEELPAMPARARRQGRSAASSSGGYGAAADQSPSRGHSSPVTALIPALSRREGSR